MQGFILLCVQAHLPELRPPPCKIMSHEYCPEAKGYKALIFFAAIYLVALGSGCLKPNIISHGADQFRRDDSKQSKKLSSYFNCAYFAFCIGELIALTVLVWVQTHSGMDVGFGVSAAAMAMGLICLTLGTPLYRNKPPRGSIFSPIAQVSFHLPLSFYLFLYTVLLQMPFSFFLLLVAQFAVIYFNHSWHPTPMKIPRPTILKIIIKVRMIDVSFRSFN